MDIFLLLFIPAIIGFIIGYLTGMFVDWIEKKFFKS